MGIATGRDRPAMLRGALAAVGGIGRFIRGGDRVMVKVNAAFAAPAALSATTNPELAAELVRLCRAAGASAVLVTDNPINDPESCFALSGIGAAARAAGAELYPAAARVLPRRDAARRAPDPGLARAARAVPRRDEAHRRRAREEPRTAPGRR